jgi:hypothetical protein
VRTLQIAAEFAERDGDNEQQAMQVNPAIL